MKRPAIILMTAMLAAGLLPTRAQDGPSRTLLAPDVLRAIVNEASGELALQNELYLAGVNRNRKAEEYQKGYFETAFILDRLREYGIDDAAILDLPVGGKTTWDAESAELWIVQPELRKIADLKEVPACLCSGSVSGDTTAELVYVGPGNREEFYKDKKAEGKILLVNGSPGMARRLGVEKFGAAGLIGWSSSHPEFDRDEVGWSGLRLEDKDKPTFGFMVSQRQGQDLRDALERGQKVVVRAVVKTQQVPNYKDQMTVGFIKGTQYPDEELVFTAHLFEGWAKQGANDNISGCTAILETARVLRKLVNDGKIPPLKRSVRFLFVPEISGTAAYLEKYPDITKKMFADINLDMVGEGLIKNLSYMRLHQTPWSLPTYLNDVMASCYEWMGDSQKAAQEANWRTGGILAPTGSRDPFYYQIEDYSGGSDHDVFIDGSIRIPAVLMIVWPDQWYHTSGDTVDKSDATQFKRVVAISTAAAVFLANAGPAEAERMLGEVASRQMGRLGRDKAKAERLLGAGDPKTIHVQAKEARVVISQAFLREKAALASARFFVKGDRGAEVGLQSRLAALDGLRAIYAKGIDDLYASRCLGLNVKLEKPALTADEIRCGQLVPVRTKKMGGMIQMWEMRGEFQKLKYEPPLPIMMAEEELRNFIDNTRSILDIRDAASAEFEPISLKDVEEWVNVQAKLGLVEIKKR
ncbi:MAG: M28 family peptidase [Candidatus Aminicenantales bacterium]